MQSAVPDQQIRVDLERRVSALTRTGVLSRMATAEDVRYIQRQLADLLGSLEHTKPIAFISAVEEEIPGLAECLRTAPE
jgi:hypothetical protein